jgi:ABC-type multidrug transport system fused ATPase/permease subunit
MRTRPLLAVVDEPTAALDPPTKYRMFQRLAETARVRSSSRAVTIVVSHRFSRVRGADLILVLGPRPRARRL